MRAEGAPLTPLTLSEVARRRRAARLLQTSLVGCPVEEGPAEAPAEVGRTLGGTGSDEAGPRDAEVVEL
jgi:hypothetical protein